jgi:chemotaxis protein MotB
MKVKYIIFAICMSIFGSSCVSVKKFKDLDADYLSANKTNELLSQENRDLDMVNMELNENVLRLSKRASSLELDTINLGIDFRKKVRAYTDLSSSYEMLIKSNSTTMAKQAKENRSLMERLGQMDIDLQERERAILSREQDVLALENLLKLKDENLNQLKNSVASALLGFTGEGLTVEQRDGKLYVSLENSLLFASGSWTVNDMGKQAINELAKVLAKQTDLQIMVEGHTDDVPYNGTGIIKDNWDLSVMRATAIVRVLSNNKGLDAKKITAAGKGPYSPLVENNSPENRAINRRTEIILSPNMDELMNLLD